MLKLKPKSIVRRRDSGGASYREVYYGTREEVEERSNRLAIGDRDKSGEYELVSWRTRQIGGPVYEIELNWENLNAGSNLRFLIGRHGPKEHTLDVSVMSVPLERHSDYRTNWNYCLAAKETDVVPAWWMTATDPVLTAEQRASYRWVKTPQAVASLGESWHLLKMPILNCETWLMPSYTITDANIPYTYSGFVWRTSGTGVFSDSLSLRASYFPSQADFEAGEVTLTLRVVNNGMVKTDAMHLVLNKELKVYAGENYYGGMDRPLLLNQAEAYNYDSLRWQTLGDGHFEDAHALHTIYYPGEEEKELGLVSLVLEAWSVCGRATSTIRFDLFKDYALEGKTWTNGMPRPNTQVIAASLSDGNLFMSGFYRTVSDAEGTFRFEALLPDTYILYAFPDTLEVEAGGCYYLGDLQWNESNMIVVDGDVYDVDIALPVREQGFGAGEGRIGGTFDFPEMTFKARDFYCQPWLGDVADEEYCTEGLSNVGILLLNATKQRVLGFALTDPMGKFSFRGLPYGTYHVMADLPRYGRGLCEEITLSPEQPYVMDLHLYVSEEGKVRMRQDDTDILVSRINVFPNPTEDGIMISGLKGQTEYDIRVMNGLGVVVLENKAQTTLLGECDIAVADLPVGIYFVHAICPTESKMVKFIKR